MRRMYKIINLIKFLKIKLFFILIPLQHKSVQKQFEQAKDEAQKSAQETERLLQVVQMTQEEQNAKEKQIMDLQQYVEIV